MMSFITLHKQSWKSQSYAAACGISDKVLWQTQKDRSYIGNIRDRFGLYPLNAIQSPAGAYIHT